MRIDMRVDVRHAPSDLVETVRKEHRHVRARALDTPSATPMCRRRRRCAVGHANVKYFEHMRGAACIDADSSDVYCRQLFGACRRRTPRPRPDRRAASERSRWERVFRYLQICAGPRRSPSACSEILEKNCLYRRRLKLGLEHEADVDGRARRRGVPSAGFRLLGACRRRTPAEHADRIGAGMSSARSLRRRGRLSVRAPAPGGRRRHAPRRF